MELTRLPKIKVNLNQMESVCEEFNLQAPIMGYEIRQPNTKYTEYKIFVHLTERQGWFVYRRYREFYKLRNDLKKLFPDKVFSFPPKRYFGDNYDPRFLNSRRQGLQGFLYMVTRQREIFRSAPVVAFLALDNPPSINDNVEQCRAAVEQLESLVDKLRTEKSEQLMNITSLNSQIVDLHDQKQAVLSALRFERQQNGKKYYAGDDLSLMFEYRALPEVCRIDVGSFLVRKPPAYLARKFEEKARKFDEKPRKFDEKLRKVEEKARSDETKWEQATPARTHRSHSQPRSDSIVKSDNQKENFYEKLKKNQPQIEIKRAPKEKKISLTEVAKPANTGEFQSIYDLKIRRKSMPGAVEWHRVTNLVKTTNNSLPCKQSNYQQIAKPQSLNLEVPDYGRPRSYSAGPPQPDAADSEGGVKRQSSLSLENHKSTAAWSSLKDLRKLKTKV